MNLVAIIDVFAVIAFFLAFCVIITIAKKKISTQSRVFILFAAIVYLIVQVSNVLEHSGLTDMLDKYEDYFELLFIPFFLAFLFDDFNWLERLKLKRAQRKLRESEARFRDLSENSSDWIWEIDENDIFTYSSPNVFEILGYRQDEIIGKSAFDLMSEKEAEKVNKEFTQSKEPRIPFKNMENVNRHKNKQLITLETSGIPIFDENGEFRGYRGIDRDISERKKVEEEKEKLIKELKEAVNEIQTLRGIIPICSYCKNIRDPEGLWHKIEQYVEEHSDADFSHGICPNCFKEHCPEEFEAFKEESKKSQD